MKIKVSVSAYNEIVTALERLGVKADGTTELTLEKGTQLSCPIDFKMVTIRRDVATIAKDCYKTDMGGTFVEFCDQIMNWIINQNQLTPDELNQTRGWK